MNVERQVVALDTNVLMMPVELDVRTFDHIERLLGAVDLVVPQSVLQELDELATGAGKAATAASVGRELAETHCRTVDDTAASTDASIIGLATAEAVDYVATNDAAVRAAVLDAGIPVISLRGRTQMDIIRP